jgi:hypothetical protein
MEVNAVCSRFSSWVGLALVSLFLSLGGSPRAIAQSPPLTATLDTNRGCGASAVFDLGESISFRFSVSQNAFVTLRLRRPDGTMRTLLFNQPAAAGMIQSVPGVIGSPTGDRLLILDAVTASQSAHVECVYTARAAQSPLTVMLQTNRGCGANAVFALGEQNSIRYQVSKNAFVTLRLRRPDGTMRTLLFNQPVPGGVTQAIPGVIGTPTGDRLLTLDAVTATESAHAECVYTATSSGSQLTLSLQLNRGCGAMIRVGEAFAANYSASADTFLTLLLQRADGTMRVIFSNRFARGGQTYSVPGLAAMPLGGRTLILQTAFRTPGVQTTCTYTVIQ